VVIFPGVRIERHESAWISGLDEPSDGDTVDRPRKSS
jgi:hypothetical protein